MSVKPRRYLAFHGDTYYPAPGWRSFVGSSEQVDIAIAVAKESPSDPGWYETDGGWWQVVDVESGRIVAGEGTGHAGLGGPVLAGPPDKPEGEPGR